MSKHVDNQTLPSINTQHDADEIRDRLRTLSKRGKLPGYEQDEPDAICSVAAHGTPFDSKLILTLDENQICFRCVVLPMMPRIFALVLVIAVWPGLPLTDTFLTTYGWYNGIMDSVGLSTWHWYLPLTILPSPFAFRTALMKSKSSAHESAMEQIEKIRGVL